MNTVNSQIPKANHEAINTQVLPQIQNTIRQVRSVNVNNGNVQVREPALRTGDIANEQSSGPSLFQKDTLQDNRGECHYTINILVVMLLFLGQNDFCIGTIHDYF